MRGGGLGIWGTGERDKMGRDCILLLKVLGCDGEVGCLVGVRFAARVICLCKGAKRVVRIMVGISSQFLFAE